MKFHKKLVYVFALFGLLAVVPLVNAATMTFSGTYNGPTDVTNQPINVSQFDSSLGTLLSATFELDATMTTSAYATNDGDFYVGWDKTQYEFSLTGDTGYSSVAISASNAPIRIVGSGTPDGSFDFSDYAHIIGQPDWTQAGPTLTDSNTFSETALAAFIGTGDLNFLLTTANYDYFATLGAGSPSSSGLSTSIIADVSVTYEYDAVPIPSAIWLLGSGLIGLVGFHRKFRKV